MKRCWLMTMTAAVLSLAALAGAQQINFQGKLNDASGQPLASGMYTMEFNIYDDPLSGSRVWGPFLADGGSADGHADRVMVAEDGRFNCVLGPVDTSGASVIQAFEKDDVYVELRVEGGDPILPRQKFLASPFAFRLPNVHTKNGKVGIGTTDPRADLHIVSGDKPTLKLQSDGVDEESGRLSLSQSNETGFDIYYDGASGVDDLIVERRVGETTPSKAVVVDVDTGNVGVGVPTPTVKLDVDGDIKADGAIAATGDIGFAGSLYASGVKPFKMYRFKDIGDNAYFNTGISATDYDCVIAGFWSGSGDIDENDSGQIIRVYTYVDGGTWRVRADFNTDGDDENWDVAVLAIHRSLCQPRSGDFDGEW